MRLDRLKESTRWILVVVAMLVAVLALSACGSDDDSDGGGSTSASTAAAEDPSDVTMIVAGWGDVYNEATKEYYADPFHAEGGAAIKFDDSPATQVAKINAQNRANKITWDMLDSVAGADAFLLEKQGFLEPIPPDLKAKWQDLLGEQKVSDFGFTMGNLSYAIVCNMDLMDSCPKTMEEFFDVEKFPQERELPASAPLVVLTMASVANGMDPASSPTTEIDMDAAFETLEQVKPKVKVFYESTDQAMKTMKTGEVPLALLYSGPAYRLKDEGMNVEINKAGGAYEPGYWAVLKASDNKDQAFKLMDWIATHPEAQIKFSEKTTYSIPSPEAFEKLPKEKAERLADYPPNFAELAVPNYQWYNENADEVNARWQDYVQGG